MSAGVKTEYLTIETAALSENSAGEDEKTFSELTSIWARPDRPSAAEGIKQGVTVGPLKITFIADYIGDARSISADDRVIWVTNGSMILVVRGVAFLGQTHSLLAISCEQYQPGEAA